MKKFLTLFLVLVLALSLVACGDKPEAKEPEDKAPEEELEEAPAEPEEELAEEEVEEEDGEEEGVLRVLDMERYDEGEGEVILESQYGRVFIPEGLKYEIETVPDEDETYGDLFRFYFGEKFAMIEFGIQVIDDLDSLEGAVERVIDYNTWDGGDHILGEKIKIGQLEYQQITIENEDGGDSYYLVSYFEHKHGGAIVELFDSSDEDFYKTPLAKEMLEKTSFE